MQSVLLSGFEFFALSLLSVFWFLDRFGFLYLLFRVGILFLEKVSCCCGCFHHFFNLPCRLFFQCVLFLVFFEVVFLIEYQSRVIQRIKKLLYIMSEILRYFLK